ncbi:MAG TPA: class I SAM-dependent methyltransferase [Desulfuromonadales bacterium]|nr:class I SAM-dependent methyltransferase [Desulfuromonadales bacterium]
MPVEQIRSDIREFVSFIPKIADMDNEEFDQESHRRLHIIEHRASEIPEQRDDLMAELFALSAEELEASIMCRHSRTKPLGYAGDHVMIDMIYDRRADSFGRGKLWDEFYHRQAAPQAVRNRKTFFVETFTDLCRTRKAPSVLDIACGPCRDVVEAIAAAGENATGSHFYCTDMDPNAITYAQTVIAQAAPQVTFRWETANAFRMKIEQKFDLVWSAGLFDYLDERTASLLLKKMWGWTADGGELIVGNFHVSNQDRLWMEWCGDWRLIHRTEEDMFKLCDMARIPLDNAGFYFEPMGVNMFLRVRKG